MVRGSAGWKDASAKKLGGTWYSTVSAGYGSAWSVVCPPPPYAKQECRGDRSGASFSVGD